MPYAIFLQVTDETWDYLRKKPGQNIWNDQDPVTLWDTKEEAEEECANWNTGSVVEYKYEKKD